jgi:hypothetical protein
MGRSRAPRIRIPVLLLFISGPLVFAGCSSDRHGGLLADSATNSDAVTGYDSIYGGGDGRGGGGGDGDGSSQHPNDLDASSGGFSFEKPFWETGVILEASAPYKDLPTSLPATCLSSWKSYQSTLIAGKKCSPLLMPAMPFCRYLIPTDLICNCQTAVYSTSTVSALQNITKQWMADMCFKYITCPVTNCPNVIFGVCNPLNFGCMDVGI